ncbi:MAG: hypothetical protein LBK82_02085 [Planctomycetaceae bacterium]|nr:hypothetical protein [Planctomycetaceae bacterium]
MGNPSAGRLRRLSPHFTVVNRVHCRRVRRRDLSAKGRPPIKGHPPTKGCPPDDCLLFYYSGRIRNFYFSWFKHCPLTR